MAASRYCVRVGICRPIRATFSNTWYAYGSDINEDSMAEEIRRADVIVLTAR